MQLDIPTLLVIATANLFIVSIALLTMVGSQASAATRCAQLGVVALVLGGVASIAAGYAWAPVLAPLAVALFGLCQWLLHRALGSWLGHRSRPDKYRKRPIRRSPQDWLDYRWCARCLLVLLVAAPLGYVLGFASPDFQLGWSHLCLAAMLLLVARATLFPLRHVGRAWRWWLCACLVGTAGLMLVRAVVGIWGSEAAQQSINLTMAVTLNLGTIVSVVALLAAWRDEAKARLHNLAMTDGLTGLLNRRGWMERAEGMFANAQRYQQPLTLMMLDLDHFKRINDTHGHEVGDKALKLFARLLRESRRTGDLVGRLGGEEFCIVLANTHRSASIGFDQRLRAMLQEVGEKELGFHMNFSAGVAVLRDGDGTLAGLLARADTALYSAKHEGRGRMVQSDGGLGQTVI
ncbi:diguanylate cyclase (GGDEF)-like protein [Rhodoferax ferrireducens]|uniref:diguanylate cyclase n=1 Tax=Rhodoferax ferrireducens TaxID=192843 RepID=A0ABU2CEP6_9BURK|nr:GGDEF domain-containing protein [Rhodoferax ferrireducens]MDR7379803.1 diguanylate cyclase (GGDEF)-like protein [Rhodoferax ferrireducens]